MVKEPLRIPARFRLALLAKGLLLMTLAGCFVWLGVEGWGRLQWPMAGRLAVAAFATALAIFLGWAAALALLDVALGHAIRSTGAVLLPNRRSGYSLKLPGGRHLEYILHNPWQPLQQRVTYTVLYGRFSGVLVAPPEREDASV